MVMTALQNSKLCRTSYFVIVTYLQRKSFSILSLWLFWQWLIYSDNNIKTTDSWEEHTYSNIRIFWASIKYLYLNYYIIYIGIYLPYDENIFANIFSFRFVSFFLKCNILSAYFPPFLL